MNTWVLYIIIAVVLVAAELVYFRVADKYNLVEKQKENGHVSAITRRGGGVIFLLSIVIWGLMMLVLGNEVLDYIPFLCGLLLVAGISFVEEFRSVPDSVRVAYGPHVLDYGRHVLESVVETIDCSHLVCWGHECCQCHGWY